ncbi:MAG: class I SAM-dependent methyltransferase [Rivularia sp. (in: Bacteria)]|nr:class I SAM-dependent methyltransferase [Rivularia sp. MS3]
MNQSLSSYKLSLPEFLKQNPFTHPLTQGFFYREKMHAIHRVTPDFAYKKVLEVGGGQSGLSAMLFPQAQITNIDLNSDYANSVLNQQHRVKFICGDATNLPFEDSCFDAVTMFDLLEHIPDDKTAISEALRVLRPGGILLISTPNENWKFPYYEIMQSFCPKDSEVMAEWGHVRRGYTLENLENLIGLTCENYATFINPITVIGHDIAFSRLPYLIRQSLSTLVIPLTLTGYFLHKPDSKGTETAYAWRKP